MLNMSRRRVLASAAVGAAFGLNRRLELFTTAFAETPLEPTTGFYRYKVGDIEVTAVYDGIWRKPHDPTFIKNASVDDTKAALAQAGLTTDFMPIPLTVVVLKIGDKLVMVDAGSGVGQWQANATHLPANMKAAGIDHTKISTILVSHFHPDHVWGLMEKGTNAAVFPNAELIVNGAEYKWWTDPSRVEKLAEGRKKTHRQRFLDLEQLEARRRRRGSGAGRSPGRVIPPHSRPFRLPRHFGQGPIDGVERHRVRARFARPAPGMGGDLRSERPDGGRRSPQADRPRHRREDDDLRRPFPVPRRRRVRQGRRCLQFHASRSILNAKQAYPENQTSQFLVLKQARSLSS
jgi:glyoxylase-like metal-dependent hydrolase (beta-lactamase superfamily II)